MNDLINIITNIYPFVPKPTFVMIDTIWGWVLSFWHDSHESSSLFSVRPRVHAHYMHISQNPFIQM